MQAFTFVFAFVAVLALIGAAAWLVRRFAGNRLGTNTNRGRMPRLAVIDAAAVDGRRRLVLVRRDNVEHLLMIGGPTDIVVEPNIVRAGRDQMQQRANAGTELPRISALPDASSGTWADGDGGVDRPEPQLPEPPPARPARPAFADEARRPAAMSERRADVVGRADAMGRADAVGRAAGMGRADPPARAESISRADILAGFGPEPLPRTEEPPALRVEPPPSRMPRGEPPLMPRASLRPVEPPARAPRAQERAAAPPPPAPAPAAPPPGPTADQNLADMAQRLEAALRRPPSEARAETSELRPSPPEPPPSRPAPRSQGEGPMAGAARNPAPAAPPSSKTGFENLEDEMASLLGRPKNPS